MKSLLFGLCLLMISNLALADEISGTWQVAKRSCADGSAPADSFAVNQDQETWTFDAAKAEFSYQLRYDGGALEVRGTYTTDPAQAGIYQLSAKSLRANRWSWENPWRSSTSTLDIQVIPVAASEIQILQAGQEAFQQSCDTENPLTENFVRP